MTTPLQVVLTPSYRLVLDTLNFPLGTGPLSTLFLRHCCADFRSAARWVHALPYGRNSDRADYSLVLSERRGTCSTKHALLAALASEASVHVPLRMGIFMMDEANTPGIGPTLQARSLTCVPEAHCYLVDGGHRIDLTFSGSDAVCSLEFVAERDIAPDDIGEVKLGWHRAFVEHWARSKSLDAHAVWAAREACIAQLRKFDERTRQ